MWLAADDDGVFRKTWRELSTARRNLMSQAAHKVVPWLLHFEETWATDWILKKLIDQQVHDAKRTSVRQRMEGKIQRLTKHGDAAFENGMNISIEGNIS